ncbi:hypothetical protein [Algoriphagus boritolerans]|uniref:hypothetical protein n=1 Tax=Algoriphagus boritolerans TaxID=308111 RepID=UPI002FCE23CD
MLPKLNNLQKIQARLFLSVAVDAVVPFVLHVANTVLYLIYQLFSFELKLPIFRPFPHSIPISW